MNIKINIPRKIFLPIIIVLMIGFVVLDQAVKNMVLSSFADSPFYLSNYLALEVSKNYGIAFGLSMNMEIFYSVVLLFLAWMVKAKVLDFVEMDKKEILAVSFILSGALGNMIDRVRFGYIVDYINFKDIVIFNLADVFILAGAVILLEELFRGMKNDDPPAI